MTIIRAIWPGVLLGLYPLLVLLNANWTGAAVVRTLLSGLASTLVVALGGLWLTRRLQLTESQQTGLVALLAVTVFYPGVVLGDQPFRAEPELAAFVGVWIAVSGMLALVVLRLPRFAIGATFVRVFALLLSAGPTYGIARRALAPVDVDARATAPANAVAARPDIYLILLDKYTRSDVLREQYSFDNTTFERALQDRGFIVPIGARANYVHTFLSLASLLNWSYLDSLTDRYGQESRNYEAAYRMIRGNRLVTAAQQAGYEVVLFESAYPIVRDMRDVDRTVALSTQHSGILPLFWERTLPVVAWRFACTGPGCIVRRTVPFEGDAPVVVRLKLDSIAAFASRNGVPGGLPRRPQLVIAHLLLPHEPYIFDSRCAPRDAFWPMADTGRWRSAYLEQIQCTNRLLLDLVDRILAASGQLPVILLQADHGHGGMTTDALMGATIPLEELGPAVIKDRVSVFAAYHLPSAAAALGPALDSVTLVNLLPLVLNEYLGTRLPLQPDRVLWSDFQRPYAFTSIDSSDAEEPSGDVRD